LGGRRGAYRVKKRKFIRKVRKAFRPDDGEGKITPSPNDLRERVPNLDRRAPLA